MWSPETGCRLSIAGDPRIPASGVIGSVLFAAGAGSSRSGGWLETRTGFSSSLVPLATSLASIKATRGVAG